MPHNADATVHGDILAEITEKRRADIMRLGCTFGCAVPERRLRPVVPFMRHPGTILEIKRASPSKGMIAPDLDAVGTAEAYVRAGTEALSVLTESNYFHGSLDDLMHVADGIGARAAVLRKDFLLSRDEIDVSFKCGADAVLLIARILDKELLLSMAGRAFGLGIAVLLEIREDADCSKAYDVMMLARNMNAADKLVIGINSRDLSTFRIDTLVPARIRYRLASFCKEQQPGMELPPVVAESGITSARDAAFTAGMGFQGVLIGEAAARNPGHVADLVNGFMQQGRQTGMTVSDATFWNKVVSCLEEKRGRPVVKICGITCSDDAVAAVSAGADILGFVFYKQSRRNADAAKVKEIKVSLQEAVCHGIIKKMPLLIGVLVDPSSAEGREAESLVRQSVIDGIQFHGCIPDGVVPGYGAVRVKGRSDIAGAEHLVQSGVHRVLIDAFEEGVPGGTGRLIDDGLAVQASSVAPLWIAGGISPENVHEIITKYRPELIDVSSGVEKCPGIKDHDKIQKMFAEINKR